jgi:hypothetical protein
MLEGAKRLRITRYRHECETIYKGNQIVGGGLAPARPPSSIPGYGVLVWNSKFVMHLAYVLSHGVSRSRENVEVVR